MLAKCRKKAGVFRKGSSDSSTTTLKKKTLGLLCLQPCPGRTSLFLCNPGQGMAVSAYSFCLVHHFEKKAFLNHNNATMSENPTWLRMASTAFLFLLLTFCFHHTSLAQYRSNTANLVKKLLKPVPDEIRSSMTLFVPPVPNHAMGMSAYSYELSEDLSGALVQERVKVLERARLAEILKEMNLQLSGLFDENTVSKVGSMLGASHMVIGHYNEEGAKSTLILKLVEIKTGVILSAANDKVARKAASKKKQPTTLTGEYLVTFTKLSDRCGQEPNKQTSSRWLFYQIANELYLQIGDQEKMKLSFANGRYVCSYKDYEKFKDDKWLLFFGSHQRCVVERTHQLEIMPDNDNFFKVLIRVDYKDVTGDFFPGERSTCQTIYPVLPCEKTYEGVGGRATATRP